MLSKLLDGSGYNVIMTCSRDAHAPLEIVLSARSAASRQTAATNQGRNNSAPLTPEPQPDYPSGQPGLQSIQNPFANGGPPPQDPQQFMQEILDRQHQIDQQQQQNNQQ